MMNLSQFDQLSWDLRSLVRKIPLNWGAIQNDRFDALINMFEIDTFNELERAIYGFDDHIQNYLKRRWYLWKCSKCDEYLFTRNANAEANPNPKSHEYDVMFYQSLPFDIKGTVIPQDFRNNIPAVIADPQKMIEFFYTNQSTGVRNYLQNRLFIIHHSFIDPKRELYLRCAWRTKEKLYELFVKDFGIINFKKYNSCTAGVIYISERQQNVLKCIIDGYNNNQPIQL